MAGEVRERWARDYVFDILKELGIHYIFGVPGTKEIPIIDGTSYPENEVRYIECLHENIAMGPPWVWRGYSWLFLIASVLGCYVGYRLSKLMMDLIFRINAGVSPSSLTISFTGILLISALTIGIRVWLVLRTKPTEVLKGN